MPHPQHQFEHKAPRTKGQKNLADKERFVSGTLGSALIAYSLFRFSRKKLALTALGGLLVHRAITGFCSVYEALDLNRRLKGERHKKNTKQIQDGFKAEEAVTIMKTPDELYRFWRNLPNLAKFMRHLENVELLKDGRSRWIAQAPLGVSASWTAKITKDQKNKKIEWQSTPESWIDCTGSVRFKSLPKGRGTEVRVKLKYKPPLGNLGHQLAKLFGDDPSAALRDDLRSFRALMESGEIPFAETQAKTLPQEVEEKQNQEVALEDKLTATPKTIKGTS